MTTFAPPSGPRQALLCRAEDSDDRHAEERGEVHRAGIVREQSADNSRSSAMSS